MQGMCQHREEIHRPGDLWADDRTDAHGHRRRRDRAASSRPVTGWSPRWRMYAVRYSEPLSSGRREIADSRQIVEEVLADIHTAVDADIVPG